MSELKLCHKLFQRGTQNGSPVKFRKLSRVLNETQLVTKTYRNALKTYF